MTVYASARELFDLFCVGQSEETFVATVATDAVFLRINNEQSIKHRYLMSTAKSVVRSQFKLNVLANKLDWNDSQTPQGFVNVTLAGALQIRRRNAQTLRVQVVLKPLGSCEHSDVIAPGMDNGILLHNKATGLKVHMVARDTDGHAIVRTRCEFKAWLVYNNSNKDELAVVRDGHNGSIYTAAIPADFLRRKGEYHVEVKMLKAWNGTAEADCTPQKWVQARSMFRVECAGGFYANQGDNNCKHKDLNSVCKTASISTDGLPVKLSNDTTTMIGQSSKLTVTTALTSAELSAEPPCSGWSPSSGKWKGAGGSCATWGSRATWCYADSDYSGPGHESLKESDTYHGKFYLPCEPAYVVLLVPLQVSINAMTRSMRLHARMVTGYKQVSTKCKGRGVI